MRGLNGLLEQLTLPGTSARTYAQAPVETVKPRDVLGWLTAARGVVEERARRRDLRATLHAALDVIAVSWHPTLETAGPGHDRIVAAIAAIPGRTSCDPSTVTRAIARLTEWQLIYEAAPGTIVDGPDGRLRRLRAEYGLCLPKPTRTTSAGPVGQQWPMSKAPRTKTERHAAATRLQSEAVTLRGCSAAALASCLRPWFEAGWTLNDIQAGLDHRPADGRAWTFTTAPRHVPAWVQYRLRHWTDGEGQPLQSPSRIRAAAHEADQARRASAAAEGDGVASAQVRAKALAVCREVVARRGGAGRSFLDSRNADPSSSYLSYGESFTRARGAEPTESADPVAAAKESIRQVLAEAKQRRQRRHSAPKPTLPRLHSEHVPLPFAAETVFRPSDLREQGFRSASVQVFRDGDSGSRDGSQAANEDPDPQGLLMSGLITERDLEWMGWIGAFRGVTSEQIAARFIPETPSGKQVVDRRIRILRELKVIDSERILAGVSAVHTLRGQGLGLAGFESPARPPVVGQLKRDLAVVDAAIWLAGRTGEQVYSARQIRAGHCEQVQAQQYVPDLVTVVDDGDQDRVVAHEIEQSPVQHSRMVQQMKNLLLGGAIQQLVYYAATPTLQGRLTRAAQDVNEWMTQQPLARRDIGDAVLVTGWDWQRQEGGTS